MLKLGQSILDHFDELAELEARDTGKPMKQAPADITAAARYFEFYGSAADKFHGDVIPLLDGDWFTDDISERLKSFLKATFGTEHYEENLSFLENALYPENLTGKKRKTIRDYFLKDLHCYAL